MRSNLLFSKFWITGNLSIRFRPLSIPSLNISMSSPPRPRMTQSDWGNQGSTNLLAAPEKYYSLLSFWEVSRRILSPSRPMLQVRRRDWNKMKKLSKILIKNSRRGPKPWLMKIESLRKLTIRSSELFLRHKRLSVWICKKQREKWSLSREKLQGWKIRRSIFWKSWTSVKIKSRPRRTR